MYRHPRLFTATSTFQPAYRILSPSSSGDISHQQDSAPFHNPSPSYTRHRHPPPTTGTGGIDDDEIDHQEADYLGQPPPPPPPPPRLQRDTLNVEAAAVMSRESWEHGGSASLAVPLLPLGKPPSPSAGGSWKSRKIHSLLSRTPSPSPHPEVGRGSVGAGVAVEGKLGWWLWNTQRGWIRLVALMVTWNIGFGVLLVFLNELILRSGVYKFGYPMTSTFSQLVITEYCLIITASLTRSFSRPISSLGLSHLIAPPPTPSANSKPRVWSLSLFEDFLPTGIFGFSPRLATIILPLAVTHTSKLIFTYLSFAWTLRPVWNLSRSITIPITVLCTYIFANQNPPLSVTTLSSTLTITFAVAIVSIRPPWLFTWEGIVSGICSAFLAAAEPVVLITTFRRILAYNSPNQNPSSEPITVPTSFHGDDKSLSRSHYHLMHYTTILSALLILPWVFISGEAGDISRNCYILDIAGFWMLMLVQGLVFYAQFLGFWILIKTTSPLTGNVVAEGIQVIFQAIVLGGFGMHEWGWMGAMTGLGAGVWYMLGRRRECGIRLWGSTEPGEDVLWDGERRDEENEEEFLVN